MKVPCGLMTPKNKLQNTVQAINNKCNGKSPVVDKLQKILGSYKAYLMQQKWENILNAAQSHN